MGEARLLLPACFLPWLALPLAWPLPRGLWSQVDGEEPRLGPCRLRMFQAEGLWLETG